MKIRRAAAMGLSVLMALQLAGCGGSTSQSAGSGTTEARTFAAQETAAEKTAEAKEAEPAADQAAEAKAGGAEAKAEAAEKAEAKAESAAAGAEKAGEKAGEKAAEKAGEKSAGELAAENAAKTAEKLAAEAAGKAGAEAKDGKDAEAGKAAGSGETEALHLEEGDRACYWYDPALKENEYTYLSYVEEQATYLTPEDAEKYPALEKEMEAFHKDRYERSREDMDSLIADSAEVFQQSPEMEFYEKAHTRVRRADSEVYSFVSRIENYSGGVHENYYYGGYNYDTKTGKEIVLPDVVKDMDALPEILVKALQEEEGEGLETSPDSLKAMFEDMKPEEYNFTIEPEGVRFWFSPYAIASFAAGMLSAEITFEDYPELFTGKYQNAAKTWARPMGQYEEMRFLKDGKMSRVSISADMDEYQSFEQMKVRLDDSETAIEFYGFHWRSALLCREGKYYLYIFATTDGDYQVLHVVDLNGKAPKLVDQITGIFPGIRYLKDFEYVDYDMTKAHQEEYMDDESRSMVISDPDHMCFSIRAESLSTFSAAGDFRMQEDGMPAPYLDWYEVPNPEGSIELTMLQDVSFPETDPETMKTTGKMIDLKKGDTARIFRTDGKLTVWLRTKDGRLAEIRIDPGEEWPRTVDGVSIEELFEGLIFAG